MARPSEGKSYSKPGAVLLCGGKGTRIADVTGDRIPKSLVHVGGRPLISYAVEMLHPSVTETIAFATGHHSGQVKEWIGSVDLPNNVLIITNAYGTIPGMIKHAAGMTDMDPIVVCNADEIRQNFSLREALDWHMRSGALATTVVTDPRKVVGKTIVYRINEDDGSVMETSRQQTLTQEEISAGWLQHAGILIMRRETASLLRTEIDDWHDGLNLPLVEAGIMNAYVNTDVHHFNVNTRADAEMAEAFLQAMRR